MRVPPSLTPLVDQGIIEEVLRPLMSGKEAEVFLVRSEGQIRVAKIYKEMDQRSFRQRVAYTEGRKVRNSRTQRAMDKRSRFGRDQEEDAWRAAEVHAIERLRVAGVRVPEPFAFVDGVLIMELVCDANGEPAPRLVDVNFTAKQARALFFVLLSEVQKMLCAGLVHGDLSDFNVLLTPDGPVIIDLPQAVDAAANAQAGRLLVRDVKNLTSFLARHDPKLKKSRYGEEMWQLYQRGELTPTTKLTGKPKRADHDADVDAILSEIAASEREAAARREALGLPPPRRARAPRVDDKPPPRPLKSKAPRPKTPEDAPPKGSSRADRSEDPAPAASAEGERKRKKRTRGRDRPPKQAERGAPAQTDPFADLDAFLDEED